MNSNLISYKYPAKIGESKYDSKEKSLVTSKTMITVNKDENKDENKSKNNKEIIPLRAYDHRVRILVLGASGVGKTLWLKRFIRSKEVGKNMGDDVNETVSTIGIDFEIATITLPSGVTVKMEIWDTAGQEKFHCVNPMFYRKADGILIMFGFDNPSSFEKVEYWIKQVQSMCTNPNIPIVLVGNKLDRKDNLILGLSDAETLSNEHKLTFFTSSAKTDKNLDPPIYCLAEKVVSEIERLGTENQQLEKQSNHDKFIASLTQNNDLLKQDKKRQSYCCG